VFYFTVFDQINAALVRIREFLKKKKIILTPNIIMGGNFTIEFNIP